MTDGTTLIGVTRKPSALALRLRPARPTLPGFDDLAAAAHAEGYFFLDRLRREWESGENRFAKRGEFLRAVLAGAAPIAIGGINRDPYADDPGIARLRHVYVLPAWRDKGVGRLLVTALIGLAGRRFVSLRLRASANAHGFYERLGFTPVKDEHATHMLVLGGASHAW